VPALGVHRGTLFSLLLSEVRRRGVPLELGLSIGVAFGADVDAREAAADRLVGAADHALYRAKAAGGGWRVATPT